MGGSEGNLEKQNFGKLLPILYKIESSGFKLNLRLPFSKVFLPIVMCKIQMGKG